MSRQDTFVDSDGVDIAAHVPSDGGSGWHVAHTTGTINGNRLFTDGSLVAVLETSLVDCEVTAIVKDVSIGFWEIVFRFQDDTHYLRCSFSNTTARFFDQSSNPIGSTYSGTFSQNDALGVSIHGNNLTPIQNGSAVGAPTVSSLYAGTTKHGVGGGTLFGTFNAVPFSVSTPRAVLNYATPAAAFLTGTTGTGGSGVYTGFQWYRSTSPDTGYAALSNGGGVVGADTLNLTDGSAVPATPYWGFIRITDSLGATFDSNIQQYQLWQLPARVLGIGDSVMVGFGVDSPFVHFANAVRKAAGGMRDVTVYNAAEGGLKTSDWYDSQSPGSEVQPRLITAVANGVAAGCTHAMVTLGINDAFSSIPVANSLLNLTGIAEYCNANGLTATILNLPTGFAADPGAPTVLPKLLEIAAGIPALCDGGTTLLGDQDMISYLPNNAQAELQDDGAGVHPNALGTASVGDAWAFAWARAVGDVAGGATPAQIAYAVWVGYPQRTLTG